MFCLEDIKMYHSISIYFWIFIDFVGSEYVKAGTIIPNTQQNFLLERTHKDDVQDLIP